MEERYEFRPSSGAPLPPDRLGPGLIVLTGFMGTGKSTIGRALAELLGTAFADTDELVAERAGKSVAEIFAQEGEQAFRRREREVCRDLARCADLVVATGGGTLLDESIRQLFAAAGRIVLLEASIDRLLERLGDTTGRPLLNADQGPPRGRISALLAERATAYARVPLRLDTSDLGPRAAARRVAALLDLPRHEVEAAAASAAVTTRTLVGRGLLPRLGEELARMELGPRIMLLIAERLRDLLGESIEASLSEAGLSAEVLTVRDGDAHKSLNQAATLIERLAELGADRHTPLVTVGGGVTSDLGGFVAAVYMRGLPLAHVPTTLLAQVDASIGGKVAVNHWRAKNLIGCFHAPRLVLADPCVLRTLSERELAGGMAEVVKTAILGSADLFTYLEQRLEESAAAALRDPAVLERCVAECAAIKSAVVERDPLEGGERRVLNLGHTAGHALEAVGGYETLTHGEAVAVGLAIALRIAHDRGLTARDLLPRTRRLLAACGLPVAAPPTRRDLFSAALRLDKKKRAGRLRYVLPAGLGVCLVVDDVDDDEVWRALEQEQAIAASGREM